AGLAVEPAHGELVLKREIEAMTAIGVQPFERRGAAKEALRGPPCHVLHLAREQSQAALDVDDGLTRIGVRAPRRLHGLTEPDGLRRRPEDAALLDLFAAPRRLARGR